MASGTVSHGHDMDTGVDHDVHFEHAAELGAFDHGIEHVHGSDPEHALMPQQDLGALARALSFFGIGRIPLSILLTTYCYTFGFIGWASNQLIGSIFPFPWIFFWVSLFVAVVGSLTFTRSFATILAKLLPKTESYGVSKWSLVGKTGQTRYRITSTFGAVIVYDDFGNLHQVEARLLPGQEEIPVGVEVGLLQYKPDEEVFIVATVGNISRM